MDKKSGSGSGMDNPDHISESLKNNFLVKILKFFLMWIPDVKNSDTGRKKVGSGIRDKYPGSATLKQSAYLYLYL
jgi:hypothetical protein